MKKLIIFLSLLLPVSLFLSGCTSEKNEVTEDTKNDRLTVYTTVYPLYYFTERIGGEFVNVNTIYPPGADEHTYEPSQKDMIKLADSDLFIYIGLGLEGFVEKAKNALQKENVALLAAGENIHFDEHHEDEEHQHEEDEEHHHEEDGHEEDGHEEDGHHDDDEAHEEDDHHDEGTDVSHDENHEHDEVEQEDHSEEHDDHADHNHGDIDPHVWLDPIYSIELAEAIKEELVTLLPGYENQLEENFSALVAELEALNTKFENTIQNAKHKEMIVSHSAYGYWEERYGLVQISVSGLSTSQEPSQKQLENIISTAKEHDLKYIFFEQNVSSKLTEIVQKEMNAQSLTLHNLSVLTDDDIKNNRTYFSIMEDNIKALETALNE